MKSFLDTFLTPLKSSFTKASETIKPLFVEASEMVSPHLKAAGERFGESLEQLGRFTTPQPNYEDVKSRMQRGALLDMARQDSKDLEAKRMGFYKVDTPDGSAYVDLTAGIAGGIKKVSGKAIKEVSKKLPIFKGFKDLSTKIIEKLKGHTEVSKQFISDLTNSAGLKQQEREIIRNVLDSSGDRVSVKKFAKKVQDELLPLKRDKRTGKYENIGLPDDLRGNVADYSEHVWESPIETSAGQTHFGDRHKNYFGHTRIEDIPREVIPYKDLLLGKGRGKKIIDVKLYGDKGVIGHGTVGTTRRVIELQSDLYQKGALENEMIKSNPHFINDLKNKIDSAIPDKRGIYSIKDNSGVELMSESRKGLLDMALGKLNKSEINRNKSLVKLQQYNDPTAHFRMVREEIKQAGIDGKTKLQFPTGETAMKIEGLGQQELFQHVKTSELLTLDNMKKGQEVYLGSAILDQNYIITDILGEGKFKAMQKDNYVFMTKNIKQGKYGNRKFEDLIKEGIGDTEQFDISGKVDTSNPIYRFYEKTLGRYLKNRHGAILITDPQGVSWYEVPIKKEMGRAPVEAFGAIPFLMPKQEENKQLFINK